MNARQRRAARRATDRLTNPPDRVPTTRSLMRPGNPPKGSNRGGGTSLTSTQRDSTGRRSDWSRGIDLPYDTAVTAHDPRWSVTATVNPA